MNKKTILIAIFSLMGLLALAPAIAESQTVMKDIAYGEAPAQKMDVYLPSHADHAPVIFMVHGGGAGWRKVSFSSRSTTACCPRLIP
jgi:acetyl esterase/lipase